VALTKSNASSVLLPSALVSLCRRAVLQGLLNKPTTSRCVTGCAWILPQAANMTLLARKQPRATARALLMSATLHVGAPTKAAVEAIARHAQKLLGHTQPSRKNSRNIWPIAKYLP
jgi:F0F1-type ATP synthase assembly protein I